ncbi:MAG: hypothetical protein JSS50_00700 [Proteobacteria bacterium]|nr:hypothetical protein [Pseudomonadota bacterium]
MKKQFGVRGFPFVGKVGAAIGVLLNADERNETNRIVIQSGTNALVEMPVSITAMWQRPGLFGDQEVITAADEKFNYYLLKREGDEYAVIRIGKDEWLKKMMLDVYYRADRPSIAAYCVGMGSGLMFLGAASLMQGTTDFAITASQAAGAASMVSFVGLVAAAAWNAHHYLDRSGGIKSIRDRYEAECKKASTKDEEEKNFFASGEFSRILHSREMAQMLAMLILFGATTAVMSSVANVADSTIGQVVGVMAAGVYSMALSSELAIYTKSMVDWCHKDESVGQVR